MTGLWIPSTPRCRGDGGPVDHYNTDHFAEAHGQQGQVRTFDFQSGDGQHHAKNRVTTTEPSRQGINCSPRGCSSTRRCKRRCRRMRPGPGQLAGVASQHVDANAQDDIDTDHVNDLHDIHVWVTIAAGSKSLRSPEFSGEQRFLGSRHDKALLTVCFRSSCSAGRGLDKQTMNR